MQMDVLGAGGALLRCDRIEPSVHGTTAYFSVPDIDPVLGRVGAAGGKTCVPRTSIGQYGFMAHFQDTEGNRVGLHEVPKA
jgi:predicted enzyme related to lactoylglutathione lyase